MNDVGVIFVRNANFVYDVRTNKEADVALALGYPVSALGWIRDGSDASARSIKKKGGDISLELYDRNSAFGQGFKNIFNLLAYNLWIFRSLFKKRKSYSIIHSCDLDVSFPALLAARLLKKKIVYDIFDYYSDTHAMPARIARVVAGLENFVINHADAVILCNEARYKQIAGTRPKRCVVIHNTPDLDFEMAPARICRGKPSSFKVVYTGILCKEGRLLSEILESREALEHFEVHIAGDGPYRERIEQMASETPSIFYYGQVTNQQSLQLEKECDVLFATYDPSIKNNRYSAPNKLYEAMALGKPVVVSRGSCSDELVLEEKTGLIIGYAAAEFWEAVATLEKDPGLCNELGRNGLRAYATKYEWNIMKERLADLYSSLNAMNR